MRWASCAAPAAMMLALSVQSGCHSPATQATARQEAERRWKVARADVKARLAADQFAIGRVEAAALQLAEAQELDPNNLSLKLMEARILLSKGAADRAERILKTLELKPARQAERDYLLGVIHQQRLRWEQAAQCFIAACDRDPHEVAYLAASVQALLQLGHVARAQELLAAHADAIGWTAAYQAAMAECHEQTGDWAEAASAWKRASSTQEDPVVLERLALAQYRAGQWERAAATLRSLLRLAGDADQSFNVRLLLAECLLESGQTIAARAELEGLLKTAPSDPRALHLLARVHVEAGDLTRALAIVNAGLATTPHNVPLLELGAVLAYRTGDSKRAACMAHALSEATGSEPNPIAARVLELTK